jgi:hypothetical protein
MRIPPPVLMAAVLVLGVGCRRKEEAPAPEKTTAAPAPPPPANTAAAAAPTASADPGQVASYPDEVSLGTVTVEVLKDFAVHQAADLSSPILTHVGGGEYINLKATHSNWMKVEYPSGPGQLSPGWIDMRNAFDPRVRHHRGPLPVRPTRFHQRR